jgi:hypothetical protein
MPISQLDDKSFDRFLSLSGWNEPLSNEPLPGPSAEDKSWSRQGEIDRIRTSVRTILAHGEGLSVGALFALSKPVCIAVHLGRASAEQYAVLREICDMLRDEPTIAGFEDEATWNEAIAATRRIRHLSGIDPYPPDLLARPKAVAAAGRRMELRGYTILLTARGIGVDGPVLTAICADIEQRIQRLGGRRVIDAILKWFQVHGRTYKGSLLYGRTIGQPRHSREPSIPWHFLYNVAWKHYGAVSTSTNPVRDIEELAELARDMGALFDVEIYDRFDGMTIGPANFHQAFSDRIVYDELFAFQQWQPQVASRVLCSWLRHLAAAGCVLPLASLEQWEALGSSLIAKAQLCAVNITIPSEHFGPAITPSIAATVFGALAIPIDRLNKGYATPLDTGKRNSPYFPLYEISAGLYLSPPRGMVARALFERIYTLLRNAGDPHLERRMGTALERMTVEAVGLTGHMPAYAGLQYRIPNQRKAAAPFELDVADVTDKHIFFLECKKKPLTNAARAGNVLTAAVDFAQAFLMPLVQMNRHEAQLRAGGITFLNGQVLQLDKRNIQRFATTMTDHGSMHDRMFLGAVLIGLWGAHLTALNPAHQADADKVNEQLKLVADGITSLAGQAGGKFDEFVHRYIRSSWWLSIDHLYFLCEGATDLQNALSPLGSIIFGTGDIMNEIAQCDRMGLLKRKA